MPMYGNNNFLKGAPLTRGSCTFPGRLHDRNISTNWTNWRTTVEETGGKGTKGSRMYIAWQQHDSGEAGKQNTLAVELCSKLRSNAKTLHKYAQNQRQSITEYCIIDISGDPQNNDWLVIIAICIYLAVFFPRWLKTLTRNSRVWTQPAIGRSTKKSVSLNYEYSVKLFLAF